MAIQVQHKCDSCGRLVHPDVDVLKSKELTIEQEIGKVSILITVDNMSSDSLDYDNPALCCACLTQIISHWCKTGENFIRQRPR